MAQFTSNTSQLNSLPNLDQISSVLPAMYNDSSTSSPPSPLLNNSSDYVNSPSLEPTFLSAVKALPTFDLDDQHNKTILPNQTADNSPQPLLSPQIDDLNSNHSINASLNGQQQPEMFNNNSNIGINNENINNSHISPSQHQLDLESVMGNPTSPNITARESPELPVNSEFETLSQFNQSSLETTTSNQTVSNLSDSLSNQPDINSTREYQSVDEFHGDHLPPQPINPHVERSSSFPVHDAVTDNGTSDTNASGDGSESDDHLPVIADVESLETNDSFDQSMSDQLNSSDSNNASNNDVIIEQSSSEIAEDISNAIRPALEIALETDIEIISDDGDNDDSNHDLSSSLHPVVGPDQLDDQHLDHPLEQPPSTVHAPSVPSTTTTHSMNTSIQTDTEITQAEQTCSDSSLHAQNDQNPQLLDASNQNDLECTANTTTGQTEVLSSPPTTAPSSTSPSATTTTSATTAATPTAPSAPFGVEVALPQPALPRGLKINVAMAESGAKILATSGGGSSPFLKAGNMLKSDKDKYALYPCDYTAHSRSTPSKSDIYTVTIQLSEAVSVRALSIANFEYFSSSVKDFQVLGSSRYPTSQWMFLGHFRAAAQKGVQHFSVQFSHFVRFLKIRFLTHYDYESYCTISSLGVYGLNMVDELQDQLERSQQEVREATAQEHKMNEQLAMQAAEQRKLEQERHQNATNPFSRSNFDPLLLSPDPNDVYFATDQFYDRVDDGIQQQQQQNGNNFFLESERSHHQQPSQQQHKGHHRDLDDSITISDIHASDHQNDGENHHNSNHIGQTEENSSLVTGDVSHHHHHQPQQQLTLSEISQNELHATRSPYLPTVPVFPNRSSASSQESISFSSTTAPSSSAQFRHGLESLIQRMQTSLSHPPGASTTAPTVDPSVISHGEQPPQNTSTPVPTPTISHAQNDSIGLKNDTTTTTTSISIDPTTIANPSNSSNVAPGVSTSSSDVNTQHQPAHSVAESGSSSSAATTTTTAATTGVTGLTAVSQPSLPTPSPVSTTPPLVPTTTPPPSTSRSASVISQMTDRLKIIELDVSRLQRYLNESVVTTSKELSTLIGTDWAHAQFLKQQVEFNSHVLINIQRSFRELDSLLSWQNDMKLITNQTMWLHHKIQQIDAMLLGKQFTSNMPSTESDDVGQDGHPTNKHQQQTSAPVSFDLYDVSTRAVERDDGNVHFDHNPDASEQYSVDDNSEPEQEPVFDSNNNNFVNNFDFSSPNGSSRHTTTVNAQQPQRSGQANIPAAGLVTTLFEVREEMSAMQTLLDQYASACLIVIIVTIVREFLRMSKVIYGVLRIFINFPVLLRSLFGLLWVAIRSFLQFFDLVASDAPHQRDVGSISHRKSQDSSASQKKLSTTRPSMQSSTALLLPSSSASSIVGHNLNTTNHNTSNNSLHASSSQTNLVGGGGSKKPSFSQPADVIVDQQQYMPSIPIVSQQPQQQQQQQLPNSPTLDNSPPNVENVSYFPQPNDIPLQQPEFVSDIQCPIQSPSASLYNHLSLPNMHLTSIGAAMAPVNVPPSFSTQHSPSSQMQLPSPEDYQSDAAAVAQPESTSNQPSGVHSPGMFNPTPHAVQPMLYINTSPPSLSRNNLSSEAAMTSSSSSPTSFQYYQLYGAAHHPVTGYPPYPPQFLPLSATSNFPPQQFLPSQQYHQYQQQQQSPQQLSPQPQSSPQQLQQQLPPISVPSRPSSPMTWLSPSPSQQALSQQYHYQQQQQQVQAQQQQQQHASLPNLSIDPVTPSSQSIQVWFQGVPLVVNRYYQCIVQSGREKQSQPFYDEHKSSPTNINDDDDTKALRRLPSNNSNPVVDGVIDTTAQHSSDFSSFNSPTMFSPSSSPKEQQTILLPFENLPTYLQYQLLQASLASTASAAAAAAAMAAAASAPGIGSPAYSASSQFSSPQQQYHNLQFQPSASGASPLQLASIPPELSSVSSHNYPAHLSFASSFVRPSPISSPSTGLSLSPVLLASPQIPQLEDAANQIPPLAVTLEIPNIVPPPVDPVVDDVTLVSHVPNSPPPSPPTAHNDPLTNSEH